MGCGSSKSLVPPPVTAQTKPQTKKSRAKALHTAVTNSKEIVKAGRKQMALENSAKGHLQLWAKVQRVIMGRLPLVTSQQKKITYL